MPTHNNTFDKDGYYSKAAPSHCNESPVKHHNVPNSSHRAAKQKCIHWIDGMRLRGLLTVSVAVHVVIPR
ncbi:hypothetical protein OAE79_01685 [Rhodopirellula sp.]|nr:hypothetical protein [Rhodopirellula sp.]